MELHSSLKLYLFFCLSVLLLSSTHTQATTKVKYCDKKEDYAVKVSAVEISPDPVVRGEPATFKISAAASEALSGGKLVIDVSYFGLHVHTENHDLCEEASCPIAAGDFVLAHTQTLPSYTPPGSYTLKMTLEGENNDQLTCVTFKFTIGFGAAVSDI